MLTESQEQRLRDALGALVDEAPDGSSLTVTVPTRRQQPGLVALIAFVLVLAVFLPLRLIFGGSEPSNESIVLAPTSPVDPGTIAVTSEEPVGVSFGEPSPLTAAPAELRTMLSVGNVLYASVVGPTDRVMRSTDDGSTWETVLEADPGDAEGLFAAGDMVVLVIEDDNPARDTVSPSSVVSEAPGVLVFDPATGEQLETVLPRPEDPEMEGLSLDESTEGCALGGYQSWIRADGVAAGDRLVVTGNHQLVGRLADGTVICDSQVYQHLTWTSDDHGKTWELHEGIPLGAIAWTGTQFVAWSTADTTSYFGGAPDGLVVSTDGLDWTVAVSTPPIPSGSIPVGTSIFSTGDTVIAWAGVQGWVTEVPDDVTDPEQLRDVLNIGDDDELEIEQVLETIGVDLPLDAEEKEKIARFNGSSEPTGAVIAVSNNNGLNWTTSYVSEPVTGVVGIKDTYIALTSSFNDPSDPNDDSSSLLTSTDGADWRHAIDLPELGYGPGFFTATDEAVYVRGEQSGSLWRIPAGD
jgi:hypothetical protein